MILYSRKAVGVFHQLEFLLFLVFLCSCSSTIISVNAEHKYEQQPVNSQNNEYILEIALPLSSFIQDNLANHNIVHVRYTYDTDILSGAAVQFKNYKVARQLIDHPDVLNAWPIHHRIGLHAPVPELSFNNKEDDHGSKATFFVPQDKDTLRTLTSKNYIYENLKSNGSGIKIGIIDTGVDYTHPALGGCFGKGCKVAYGYDLVGNDFDGTLSSIKESHDPIDNCPKNSTSATGHGTFVSGIIGAEDNEYNWTGIAPGATLGMWKVYGCNNPGSPNDIIVKAMEMAYKAGMDVISMSLGVSGGWKEDILSVVADRLVSKGVHVVTASGNSGSRGILLAASPASGKNVIAAGATLNSHVPGYILKLEDKHVADIPYRTVDNTPLILDRSLPIVASGQSFNQENDACKSLTSHKYKDSIVLIHQGGCSFLTQVKHAQEAGAKAVVIYTDIRNTTTSVEALYAALPVAFINNNDAEIIHRAISSKKSNMEARFTNILLAMDSSEQEIDSIGSFSSLGPTNELQLKPELVAVGGDVFSTLPVYQKSYGVRSGTSFSCPYIAGSIAVFLSNLNNTNQSPELVKNALMNFASPVKPPISALPYGDSPIRQGAGVLDVAQVINGFEQFHVSPAKLSLNDTANLNQEHELTLYNHHNSDELFLKLDHDPSLTVTGYSLNDDDEHNFTPSEPSGMYTQNNSVATLHFSDTEFVVLAGKSVKVRVRVQPPVDTFKLKSHVLYGGYITVSSPTNKAQVPYFGMIGNMKDLPILDRTYKPTQAVNYTFPSIASANGSLVKSEGGHFYIQHNQEHRASVGGPYILVRLLTGTAILQIQVMDALGKKVIADVPIDSSRTWIMRNTLGITDYSQVYYTWYWAGEYVEKDSTLYGETSEQPKILESGEYRLKVRGLHVYGDRTKNEDWDEWISPKLLLEIDNNSDNKD